MTLVNGVLIQAPINQRDIQGALGLSSSVNKWSQLCTSNNINKWAKYKPVKHSTGANITDAQRQSVNYGIEWIPTWTVLGKMLYFWLQGYDQSNNAPECGVKTDYWHYQKPSGGASSPYRAKDFVKDSTAGYYHNAHAPVGGLKLTSVEITPAGNLSVVYDNDTEQSSMSLKLTDLKYDAGGQISLSGFYFGVAMVRKSGASSSSAKRYVMTDVTAQDAIEHGSHIYPVFQDDTAIGDFMSGDTTVFYAMPFLANGQIYDTFTRTSGGTTTTYKTFLTSFTGVMANKFVALWERQEITVTRRYAEATVSRLWANRNTSASTRYLYYGFVLTNTSFNDTYSVKYTLSVYKSDGVTLITSKEVTGIVLHYGTGNAVTINTTLDMARIPQGLANASYVRVVSEITGDIISKHTSSSNTQVIDGPTPDA